MIYLYQFPRMFGVPNLSPFCMKLETWLRMSGLEYENRFVTDPRKGPVGKLPAIDVDGVKLPDSTLIIEYLSSRDDISLDDHFDPAQHAVAHAFQRMMEERLYWALVYNRWLDRNSSEVYGVAFGQLPPILRHLAPLLVRQKIARDLKGHGLGLHTPDTIYRFACQDIDALADFLADKPYFMGDRVSTVDAVLLAFLTGILIPELPSPMQDQVKLHQNLVDYQARWYEHYFPDLRRD
jgi:glutathione S-transferase